MAADISTRMSVTGLSEYKKSMNEAKEAVKTLDSELKLNEQQLKLNGNQEQYMANKAELLKKQIEEQTKVVKSARQALDEMRRTGVDESSKSFQAMQRNVYDASTRLMAIKTELKAVESGAGGATTETAQMNNELKNIGQGVAFDNVTKGLENITKTLKSGAKAAVDFGKKVARSAMSSAEWADDVLTRATELGVDAETIQRMDNVADYIDTDVKTIISAKNRLAKNQGNLGELLGIDVDGKTLDEVFWESGRVIADMTDEWERTEAAQAAFGKGWQELLPIFTAGEEKYNELMESQTVLSNEQVEALGKADDAIKSIQHEIDRIKNQFWSENADKIISLMQWLMDHKDGIVAALTAIAGGFGLIKVGQFALDLTKTIEGFKQLGLIKGAGAAGTAGATAGAGAAGGGLISRVYEKIGSGLAAGAVLDMSSRLLTNANGVDLSKGEDAIAEWVDKQIASGFIRAADRQKYIDENREMLEIFGVIEPVVKEDAPEAISEQIGTVPVTVVPKFSPSWSFSGGAGGGGAGQFGVMMMHANGLWSVPFDGYMAMLHKGERVVQAREASRTYSSNLYVESMYMNNGQDAEGLAARMAAAQRRTMSGYGSN